MTNKVTKKECLDAIDYFWTEGFSFNLNSDQRYYCDILLKKVANSYNIKLEEG